MLTNSLIAWRQLECGLSEFHLALGKDRGTLKGLEGALDKGQATSVELAHNVKLVAKLLSEKVEVSQEQVYNYQIVKFVSFDFSIVLYYSWLLFKSILIQIEFFISHN